ncbi:MAG: MCP four helix bundle domain-containing protein [Betaproteobacteria bacterium]|nr:MCP four helix bundle domain-containing protein [Betaproteobacteria bacterium]
MQLGGAVAEAAQENMQYVAELLISEDMGAIEKISAKLEQNRVRNVETMKKLDAMKFDAEGSRLYAALKERRKIFIDKRNGVIELLKKARYSEGRMQFDETLVPVVTEYKKALADFSAYQRKMVSQKVEAAEIANRNSRTVVAVALLVLLAGGALGAFLIARSVTRPLREAVEVADAVARGELGREVVVDGKDETSQLLNSMRGMVDTLKRFSEAQNEIAQKHAAGTISFRMPSQEFRGVYCEMAEKLNELVASHIAVKMRVVNIVKAYAEGDFSSQMEQLLG